MRRSSRQLQMFPYIIGHSLVEYCLSVQRVYPDVFKQLVAIEGWGPAGHTDMVAPMRMREWIGQMRAFAGRHARRYASLAETCSVCRRRTSI